MKLEQQNSTSQFPVSSFQFQIEDTGPGIAPEEIPHLFEAFIQTRAGQESKEGSGLGLAISQKFVQSLGGQISVDSEVGHGTTFTFSIPIEIVKESDRVVEEHHDAEDMTSLPQNVLTPDVFAVLPVELRRELQKAVEAINLPSAYRVIEQIRQYNAPLADKLAELVYSYRFDILQGFFEERSL